MTNAPPPPAGPRRARSGALLGIAAAAAGLAAAELIAVFTGPRSAPVVAVGGVVVDTVPGPVKQLAIDLFGVYDKIVLITGTLALLTVFAAVIGMLAVRSLWYAVAGSLVFGAIGAISALSRSGAGPSSVLPSLAAVAVALATGATLLRLLDAGELRLSAMWPRRAPARRSSSSPPTPPSRSAALSPSAAASPASSAPAASVPAPSTPLSVTPSSLAPDRRRFLKAVGVAVVGAAVAGYAGRWLSTRRDVSAARSRVSLPDPASPAPPVPAGVDPPVPGLARYVTTNPDFYRIDTALVIPQVDPETWQLRIHGRVGRPITLSFPELLARPMVERHVTLACVSNEVGGDLVGNARWLGVPVKDLLDEVDPLAGADQVVSRSVDGWTCGTPTEVLRDGRDALLAVAMNGEPLPVKHGFPVRMVVPGLYGYVSACKWITELELTSFAAFDAYWISRGWAAQAPIKTQSRIDTPRADARLRAGTITVAGVAWAQRRGIEAVEVQVDEGSWQPATLATTVSIDTWRQWSWTWPATAGRHRLRVRATDATGQAQTPVAAPPIPDGAAGWHSIEVEVAN